MLAYFLIACLFVSMDICGTCIPMRTNGGGDIPITTTMMMLTTTPTPPISTTTAITTSTGISTSTTPNPPPLSTTNPPPFSTTSISTTTIGTTSTTSTIGTTTTSTSTTTTTTTAGCMQPVNTSSLFIAPELSEMITMNTPANAMCPCESGADFFYTPALNFDTQMIFDFRQQNISTFCPNLCVCTTDNICYKFDVTPMIDNGIRLISSCQMDGCYMRLVISGFNTLVNVNDMADTLTRAEQLDGNDNYLPLTNQIYLKVNKLSCNGCEFPSSCRLGV